MDIWAFLTNCLTDSIVFFLCIAVCSKNGVSKSLQRYRFGQEKPSIVSILGGTVSGTSRTGPWEKPLAVFCLIAHYVHHFVPFIPGTGGVRPRAWDKCPARGIRRLFMCFVFI